MPEWFSKLQNLAKLEFGMSRLEDDTLNVLQHLQNLVTLKFNRNSYVSEQLYFKRGSLPKLKYLHLRWLEMLYVLVIEEGAMPTIEQLNIVSCHQSEEVPSGIQHLRNLQKLSLLNMPSEFMNSVQPEGRHLFVGQHLPEVVCK